MTMLDSIRKYTDILNSVSAVLQTLIALAACAIAIISFRISRRALAHQRAHDRLSVRPLVSIEVEDFENHLSVALTNNGVGPLIVKRMRVIGSDDESAQLHLQVPRLPHGLTWTYFLDDLPGRSVRPGGTLTLLSLDRPNNDMFYHFSSVRDEVRRVLGRLVIEVAYTDIYDTLFEPTRRSLEWFRRDNSRESGNPKPGPGPAGEA